MTEKLTGEEQKELVDALLGAFPKADDVRQIVSAGLDENLEAIAGSGALRTVVFDLVQHTESRGTTNDLIAAAVKERPRDAKLGAIAKRRGVPVTAEDGKPAEGSSVDRRRTFLKRAGVVAGLIVVLGLGCFVYAMIFCAIPAIEPFEKNTRGIVLAGPWKADDPDPPFYTQLSELDAQHAVQRVYLPSRGSHEELLQKAEAAGAVLVIEVGANDRAQVYPLGELAKDALFQKPTAFELGRDGAALVIIDLARSGEARPVMQNETDPCPRLDQPRLDRFALLALLVVPRCWSEVIDTRAFQDVCGSSPDVADETCALARYLDAEHNADNDLGAARLRLGELLDHGPARFRQATRLSLAGLECREKATAGKAEETVLELAKSTEPCVLAELPAIASCIRTTAGEVSDALGMIEGRQIDPEQKCPNSARARAMARRAYWREKRGLSAMAALEYQEAFARSSDPLYALNLAELWLRQKAPVKAMRALKPLRSMAMMDWRQKSRAALLGWIAARQGSESKELVKGDVDEAENGLKTLFAERPSGDTHPGPIDKELRALACENGSSGPCVYDVLRAPTSSPADLEKSLRAR